MHMFTQAVSTSFDRLVVRCVSNIERVKLGSYKNIVFTYDFYRNRTKPLKYTVGK